MDEINILLGVDKKFHHHNSENDLSYLSADGFGHISDKR